MVDVEQRKGDFYIRIAKGYYFIGDKVNAERCLKLYKKDGCPQSWLTEWVRDDYQNLRHFLAQRSEA